MQGHWQYNDAALSWLDAETECRSRGGHLASLHSKKENDALMAYLDFVAPNLPNVWIGANDFDSEVRMMECSCKVFLLYSTT